MSYAQGAEKLSKTKEIDINGDKTMILPKDPMLVTIDMTILQYKKRHDKSEWSIEIQLCEEMILDLENIKDQYLILR